MARPASFPKPKKSRSKYVAVRKKDGEIDWDKMATTKPWPCYIPAHAGYEAPETSTCLHPDCIGPIATTIGYPASMTVKALRQIYARSGRTQGEFANDLAFEMLNAYYEKDIPVTNAHGPMINAASVLFGKYRKDLVLDESLAGHGEVFDLLAEYNDEATALDLSADRPESLAFRHEFQNIVREQLPEPIMAMFIGTITATDVLKMGYSYTDIRAYKAKAAEVLRSCGYEPDHITRYREQAERRQEADSTIEEVSRYLEEAYEEYYEEDAET